MVRFEKVKTAKRKGMGTLDRVLTIVVTATITSMVWIVAGGSLLDLAGSDSQIEKTRPGEAASEAQGPPLTQETVEATAEARPAPVDVADAVALPYRSVATVPGSGNLSQMVIPVLNVRPDELSDTFLAERGGGRRLHEAIDIMAPKGTSVIAAAPGAIERDLPLGEGRQFTLRAFQRRGDDLLLRPPRPICARPERRAEGASWPAPRHRGDDRQRRARCPAPAFRNPAYDCRCGMVGTHERDQSLPIPRRRGGVGAGPISQRGRSARSASGLACRHPAFRAGYGGPNVPASGP